MSALANVTYDELEALQADLAQAINERNRARCTAAVYYEIARHGFELIWEAVGPPSADADGMELGRRMSAFLRIAAADVGPDRLPLPAGWSQTGETT